MTQQIIKKNNPNREIHLTPRQWSLAQDLAQGFAQAVRSVQFRSKKMRAHIAYVLDALEPDNQEGKVSDPSDNDQGVTYEDAKSICKALGKVLDDDKLSGERLKTVKNFFEFCVGYASGLSAHEYQKVLGDGATKKILLAENGCISLASIGSEQDLVLGPGTHLNPPPEDGRCECCGRHISQLKPFGKVDHPIFGDVEGALLVKKYRPNRSYDAEAEDIMRAAEEYCQNNEHQDMSYWLWKLEERGEEEGLNSCRIARYCGNILASWECQDCIVLNDDEYFEKMRQSWDEQPQALSESYGGSSN